MKENENEREPSLFPIPISLKEKDKERERTSTCVRAREKTADHPFGPVSNPPLSPVFYPPLNNVAHPPVGCGAYLRQSPSTPAPEDTTIDLPRFKDFFNTTLKRASSNIPKIQYITGKRLESLQTRCREYGKETLIEVIVKAVRSPFLNGDNAKGWCASIDWLLAPNNFIKVLEGNYDRRHGKPTRSMMDEARRAANKAIEEQIHRELHESIRRREQNCVTYEEYQQMLREGRVPQPPQP